PGEDENRSDQGEGAGPAGRRRFARSACPERRRRLSPREKLLACSIGGLIAGFGCGYGGRAVILPPLEEIDRRIASSRDKLEKIRGERRACFAADDQMKAFTLRTFADTVDQASAKSGEVLTRKIIESGLSEADFTRLPVGPRKLRGAQEIGWN